MLGAHVPHTKGEKMQLVSLTNMILMGVTIVILLGALLGAILYMNAHAQGWFSGLVGGLLCYMFFGYILYVLSLFAMGKIAPIAVYFENHLLQYEAVAQFLHFAFELLAIILGMKLLFVYNSRRGVKNTLAMAVAFGIGVYALNIIIGQMLSTCVQFITYARGLNDAGIETVVKTIMEENAGVAEEDVRMFVQSVIETDGWDYVIAAISCVLKALVQVACSVLAYGVFKKKLEKKHLLTLCGLCALFYLPNIVSLKLSLNAWVALALCAVIAAFSMFVMFFLIEKKMPEEKASLSKENKKHYREEESKPKMPKMPKIKMPD